jgi:hypothetical protein
MWMDNYSKNLKWHMPDVGKGTFHQGLWTGFAVRACPEPISMRLCRDQAGDIIPAMPDNPFDFADTMKRTLLPVMFARGENTHLRFEVSAVFNWEVDNVPLRPDSNREDMKPEYAESLNKHSDTLEHLYPLRLLDINCGENLGFARCMKSLSDEKNWEGQLNMPACRNYTSMFMDCDLFDKCVKVTTHTHCFLVLK